MVAGLVCMGMGLAMPGLAAAVSDNEAICDIPCHGYNLNNLPVTEYWYLAEFAEQPGAVFCYEAVD